MTGPENLRARVRGSTIGSWLIVAAVIAFFTWAGTQVRTAAEAFWCFAAAGLLPTLAVAGFVRESFWRWRGWYVDTCRWYPHASYCEWRQGRWACIRLRWQNGSGSPIVIPDAAGWRESMPLWARTRRTEIVARVRSRSRVVDHGDG